MIPRECKRLAEVDFPIAAVSQHAVREKSIRYGHPSTLQLWWARRPLAACRAMLLALLLPDPCDPHCPDSFKAQARLILADLWRVVPNDDAALRASIISFIGNFANWDKSSDLVFVRIGQRLIRAAHGDEVPLVVDPFAGGGSIPLESLRLGCDSFASDLNPVASLLLRTSLELIPRGGPDVIQRIRAIGESIILAATSELSPFYPTDADGSVPIAYIWARTARCESPRCGAEIPLIRSLWLCKKARRLRALRPVIYRETGGPPAVQYEVFRPTSVDEVLAGTAHRGRAKCPCCGATLLHERLRAQMVEQGGGAEVRWDGDGKRIGGARLLTVVTVAPSGGRRDYRNPTAQDYLPIRAAQAQVSHLATEYLEAGLPMIPDELVNPVRPSPNARGLSAVTRYGIRTFADLFNARQKLSLVSIVQAFRAVGTSDDEEAKRIGPILSPLVGKRADYSSICTRWHLTFEKATCTFSKQALSNTWDFVEPTPFGSTSGSFGAALDTVESACETISRVGDRPGQVLQADATSSPLPDESCSVWFTDPPYYDAIPYADLSDFFFVWLRRAFPSQTSPVGTWQLDSSTGLSPKTEECVWNQSYLVDGTRKDGAFFERTIARSFAEGCRILRTDGVGCVVFAHKTTEGWEALLSGMIRSGWVITASWPIATERAERLQSQGSAALATSVHLVCRPRTNELVGEWGDVIRELPGRVSEWMRRLQAEGIRGADLVFACIGPALEVYSRYARVVDVEDREVPLGGDPEAKLPHERGYLSYVWEVVGKSALEQVLGSAEGQPMEGASGALEEDSRLTALFLWTLQTSAGAGETVSELEDAETPGDDDDEEVDDGRRKPGFNLIYDVARRFAQPLGIHMEAWEGRIIETKKGVVRLLPIRERAQILFGESGADFVADRLESAPAGAVQLDLFAGMESETAAPPAVRGRGKGRRGNQVPDELLESRKEATTLDRVHAAMLLQASGRSNALRALLVTEMARSPDFLRLANALAVLYPKDSEEKRLVEAMLLAAPK